MPITYVYIYIYIYDCKHTNMETMKDIKNYCQQWKINELLY